MPSANPEILQANQRRFDAVYGDRRRVHLLDAQGLLTYSPAEGRRLSRRIRRLARVAVPPGAAMLEIGGGNGYASINLVLASRDVQLACVDVSFGATAASLRMCRAHGIAGLGAQADAMTLPFRGGAFDVVIGKSLAHHIPALELLLREAWRVTKPGGWVLFFSDPTPKGAARLRRFKRAYSRLIHGSGAGDRDSELSSTERYARSSADVRHLLRALDLQGTVVETGIAYQYVSFLWYPVLLKLRLPAVSRAVCAMLNPLRWLDDRWLRHWWPTLACEQWIVLRRTA